jgi:hypothetical protein
MKRRTFIAGVLVTIPATVLSMPLIAPDPNQEWVFRYEGPGDEFVEGNTYSDKRMGELHKGWTALGLHKVYARPR